jgi:hypothetical protein
LFKRSFKPAISHFFTLNAFQNTEEYSVTLTYLLIYHSSTYSKTNLGEFNSDNFSLSNLTVYKIHQYLLHFHLFSQCMFRYAASLTKSQSRRDFVKTLKCNWGATVNSIVQDLLYDINPTIIV